MDSKSVLICFFSIISAASLLNNGAYAATTYIVGDKLGWNIPPLGDITYKTWAAQHNFAVGDTLVFKFTAESHSVAEVSKAAYDACNTQSPISISTSTPTNIKLSAGEHYYICTFPTHCSVGMKLAINVSAAATTSPTPQPSSPVSVPASSPSPLRSPTPQPSSPVSVPASSPSPLTTPVRHVVGDALGWSIPRNGSITYTTWASQQTFTLGDILVFNFTTGIHNVAIVNKASYDACSLQSPYSILPIGPSYVVLTSVGEHYYFCTFTNHCAEGLKLAINVSATTKTSPATSPSSTATPPSGSSTATPSSSPTPPSGSSTATPSSSPTPPSGSSTATPSSSPTPTSGSVPSPSSAAPIVVIAAMPFTLLSILFTLFY